MNRTNYFFNDIINIRKIDPDNILIYYIRYVNIKDLKYIKISSINHLYVIFNKINGYFEEINGNKYLTLVPTNACKEKNKKCEEMWSKIRDLIRSITKNSDDNDKKNENQI